MSIIPGMYDTIRLYFIVIASLKFNLHPSSSIYKHHRQYIRTGHQKQDINTGPTNEINIHTIIITLQQRKTKCNGSSKLQYTFFLTLLEKEVKNSMLKKKAESLFIVRIIYCL